MARRFVKGLLAKRRAIRPDIERMERRRLLAPMTFIVNLDDNSGGGGPGTMSLLEAINAANANVDPSPDTIVFSIPGPGVHTISPSGPTGLPTITDPVIIDGTTQP